MVLDFAKEVEKKELALLKAQLPNIQENPDIRKKRINKVGVRELIVPIKIYDSLNNIRNTVGNISLYVSLNDHVKGTSMSRLVEIIHDVLKEDVVSVDIIKHILKEIRNRLESEDTYVKINFTYFTKKKAPISKIEGYLHHPCVLEGKSINGIDKVFLKVGTYYTSLCPCSREISKHGAHNQRSRADILVEIKEDMKIDDIINMVEQAASCEIYSILKRPDEKYVTEKAYENPKFVEDVVRDLAILLDNILDKKINDYSVVVNHYEAIHIHEAVAIITAGRELR